MKLDINIFGYIVIGFVIAFVMKIYFESDLFQLKCIVSNKDGNTYCVRETPKLELVADLLAQVTNNLKKLVVYMGKKYPTRENVQRLVKKFNPKKISETLPTSTYTAFSENKGEKLAFCTTTTKEGTKLIDLNTLFNGQKNTILSDIFNECSRNESKIENGGLVIIQSTCFSY